MGAACKPDAVSPVELGYPFDGVEGSTGVVASSYSRLDSAVGAMNGKAPNATKGQSPARPLGIPARRCRDKELPQFGQISAMASMELIAPW
jgi:hypothetical protein